MENRISQEGFTQPPATASYNIVSLVGYLIGVKQEPFEQGRLSIGVFHDLEANDHAKIIRCLCIFRNALMKHGDRILTLMNELRLIDNMPEYIDPEIFTYLASKDLQVIRANRRPLQYILQINQMIAERINTCQGLFPLWLKWQYLRKLFIMPNGTKEDNVKKVLNQFKSNINIYPYHCYITIPDRDNGNYLYHDARFLSLLYEINRDTFQDFDLVRNAHLEARNKLYDFISANEEIVLVVDCENSDPFQFTAVLRNIKNHSIEDARHIKKIILYDDPHTIGAWKVLSSFTNVPIEHVMVGRVNHRKSLVDTRMIVGTCQEHYVNSINAFVLVSSDSDYWGLISSLPEVNFLILVEHVKTSDSLLDALNGAGINYCFIDDFSGNLVDIKVALLRQEMEEFFDEAVKFNVNDMLDEIIQRTQVQMTAGERQAFYDKYVKTLRFCVEPDGRASIRFAQS